MHSRRNHADVFGIRRDVLTTLCKQVDHQGGSVTRIKRLIAVVAAALTLATMGSGGALAETNGGGNSANAPGQAKAGENCSNTINRQSANEVSAGGGPKAGVLAPTNCDHFFGSPGKP
jgi:hypothetical protein